MCPATSGTQITVITVEFLDEFVRRYGDAWRSCDPTRVAAECTSDTKWQVPGLAEPLQGRAAVATWLGNLFTMVPDVEFTYPVGSPLLAVDGTQAAAGFRLRGTMRGPMQPPGFAPTDHPIEDSGIEVYEEFRDGLLHRCTLLFDGLHVARQIGAAPPPGSGAERVGVLLQRLQARSMRRAARKAGTSA